MVKNSVTKRKGLLRQDLKGKSLAQKIALLKVEYMEAGSVRSGLNGLEFVHYGEIVRRYYNLLLMQSIQENGPQWVDKPIEIVVPDCEMTLPNGMTALVEYDPCASDYIWFWAVRDNGEMLNVKQYGISWGWESTREEAQAAALKWAGEKGLLP